MFTKQNKIREVISLLAGLVVVTTQAAKAESYSGNCVSFQIPDFVESVEVRTRPDHEACSTIELMAAMSDGVWYRIVLSIGRIPDEDLTNFSVVNFVTSRRQEALEHIDSTITIPLPSEASHPDGQISEKIVSVSEVQQTASGFPHFSLLLKSEDFAAQDLRYVYSSWMQKNGHLLKIMYASSGNSDPNNFPEIIEQIFGTLEFEN